jgi:4-diphosphocytidyl-2-C-methyl-D-erythritol kinase
VTAEPGSGPDALIESLACARNDLERPALSIAPAIGHALERLARATGCRLARMSGSGATVFGLYGDRGTTVRAAQAIRAAEPGWWVRATVLR